MTDGEQRRDSYASFVGGLLDNCQLIPLSDLTAMVDDPVKFESELRALDVPAGEVRHPVVYGKLGRSRPLAVHEVEFARACSDRPVKAALPGPYLLTRTMWLDCLTDRPYETREELAEDVVRVLREEAHFLLASGAALVQLDEPVLTEVVLGDPAAGRSFMCGALSERLEPGPELDFAVGLLNEVVRGLPRERLGLHVCRGNWTRDESAVLSGGYLPLVDVLKRVDVGALFLEMATPRAGDAAVLRGLPDDRRIGVGVVNPKTSCGACRGCERADIACDRSVRTGACAADARLRIRDLRRQPRRVRPGRRSQAQVNRGGAGRSCMRADALVVSARAISGNIGSRP